MRATTTITKIPFFKASCFRAMLLSITLILYAILFCAKFAPNAELPAHSLTYFGAVLRYSFALANSHLTIRMLTSIPGNKLL
jgi:hypothetical protein